MHDLNMMELLLSKSGVEDAKTLPERAKFKPVPAGEYAVEPVTISAEKLGMKMSKNYVIASDTATGKTTIAKERLRKTGDNFISIASRISLCDAQYETFNESGLVVSHCQHVEGRAVVNGKNMIVTVDSIMKLHNLISASAFCF